MKNLLKFSAVLLMTAFLFTSCSDEVKLANDLEGEWKVTSYKFNGDEAIAFFTQFDMEYKDYDKGASEGEFTWTTTDAIVGDTEVQTGEYSINEDATKIDMTLDSTLVSLNIEIEDDVLSLDGTVDGENIIIKADKK